MKQVNRDLLDEALDLIYDVCQIIGQIASDEMISLVGKDRPLKRSEMKQERFSEVFHLKESFISLYDERRNIRMNVLGR